MAEKILLIVDDEKNTREGLRLYFEENYDVYLAGNIEQSKKILKELNVDILLTDLKLGSDDGMDLVDFVFNTNKKKDPKTICIMMTAYGSVDIAVKAMRRGVYDFVTKPLNLEELNLVIKRAVYGQKLQEENKILNEKIEEKYSIGNLLGKSQASKDLVSIIKQIADTKATVLIEGESGTGKELVAYSIHGLSSRSKRNMVVVNCAALPLNLLESELFGHEKGAFTGAITKRIGRFEEANGGTLFLDEIGEIDQIVQVKLLRAIGEKTIERVGGNKAINVDVRLITATNKNLEQMVKDGDFREDLFFRLNVLKIDIPSLRERKEDLLLLAKAFLKEFNDENGKDIRKISEDVYKILLNYNWPGNIRELRTIMERGVILSKNDELDLNSLPINIINYKPEKESSITEKSESNSNIEELNLEKLEIETIKKALLRTEGNVSMASSLLGISRRTLHRKIKLLNIN